VKSRSDCVVFRLRPIDPAPFPSRVSWYPGLSPAKSYPAETYVMCTATIDAGLDDRVVTYLELAC